MNQESEYRGCLRVLCLEDSPVDAELAGEVLAGAGYELEMDVAMGRTRFEELLGSGRYDLILADFSLPDFDAHAALELARRGSAVCRGPVEVRPFQPEPDA